MKFAFLIAVLIALVAVSSATWTVDWPVVTPAVDSVGVGATFNAAFKTDAIVKAGDAFTGYALAGISEKLTKGATNVVRCSLADKEAVVNGIVTVDLAVDDIVTCKFRADYTVASDTAATITVTGGTAKSFKTVALTDAPVIVVDSTSEKDSKLVDFSVTFSKLQANTRFGPLKFEFTYGDKKTIATTPRVANSDFVTEIGTGVFLHTDELGAYYIVTTTGTTGTLKSVTQQAFNPQITDTTMDYSLAVSLQDPSDTTKWFSGSKGVATWTKYYGLNAQIGRANGVVSYSFSGVTTTEKPTAKFSISTFDEATIFGTGSTLQINGVDATTKAFTQETTLKAGDAFKLTGTFPFTGAWTELATIDASLSGVNDSSTTEQVPVEYKVKIGSLSAENVIDYTVTVALSSTTTYTGSVKHVTDSVTRQKLFLQQAIGDVRKVGEYNPDCSATNGSVSVDSKVTKDNADLNLRSMVIEGTVSKDNSIVVTCKQTVGAGSRSSDTVTLVTENSKPFTAVTKIAAADTKQGLTVTWATPITSAADWDAMITAVIAAIKAAFPVDPVAMAVLGEDFKTLEAKNFHYSNAVQHYGSHDVGMTLDFASPVAYFSAKGASLSFVLDLATDITPKSKQIITPTFVLTLADLTGPGNTVAGWTPAAVFLDGTTAASYEATQYVQYGSGVKCDTTSQCAQGAYCNNGVCSTIDLLTVAQQDAIVAGGSDSGSGASALFSGLAIVVAVVVALLA